MNRHIETGTQREINRFIGLHYLQAINVCYLYIQLRNLATVLVAILLNRHSHFAILVEGLNCLIIYQLNYFTVRVLIYVRLGFMVIFACLTNIQLLISVEVGLDISLRVRGH